MRTLYCPKCSSPDVAYRADILIGCCEHKSGEIWYCNSCGEEMMIQIVYSDDQSEADCPHEKGVGCGSDCTGCDHKSSL